MDGWSWKIEDFSVTINKVLCNKVLEKKSIYFIDKVALSESKVFQKDTSGERYPNGCAHTSDSTSDPKVPHDGNLVLGFESNAASYNCSLEESE